MNSKFFILDPLATISFDDISKGMVQQLKSMYGGQGYGIPTYVFDDAFTVGAKNGFFDFNAFKTYIQKDRGYTEFSDKVVTEALDASMRLHLKNGFDSKTIDALLAEGKISFLIDSTSSPELLRVQDAVVRILKEKYSNKITDMGENNLLFKGNISKHDMHIIRQKDKKERGDKTLEYADYLRVQKLHNEPTIISARPDELIRIETRLVKRENQKPYELLYITQPLGIRPQKLSESVRAISQLSELRPRQTIREAPNQPLA